MKKPLTYAQQPEEPTAGKVAEPAMTYQNRATLELEADKAQLIRAIANIDSPTLFDKVKRQLREVLNLMETKEATTESEQDSDEQILANLKEAFREMQEIKEGKLQARPYKELLKELEEEDDD